MTYKKYQELCISYNTMSADLLKLISENKKLRKELRGQEMSFEELWEKISEMRALPDTAIQQVPHVLSDAMKKKLSRKTAEEAIKILREAIEEIDHGSVQTVDALVRKRL